MTSRIGGGGRRAVGRGRPSPARSGRGRWRRLEVSRRAGARPRIHQEPRKAVRLRQAGARALLPDDEELPDLRFRQELLPRRVGARADQGEAAGLDLARHLDDADHLSDLDPARHPQGGARRRALRHLDLRRARRRLRGAGLSGRRAAADRVRRLVVLPVVPLARADVGQLGRAVAVGQDRSTTSGIWRCR